MTHAMSRRARTYARAFLSTYYTTVTDKNIAAFGRLYDYCVEHKEIILMLSSNSHNLEQRVKGITFVLDHVGCGKPELQLITLLIEHRALTLLPAVCRQIITYARYQRHEATCLVSSSHELKTDQKAKIIAFIEDETGWTVIPQFTIDHSLIGGVRVKSDTFIWECSVVGHLQKLRSLITQGKV